MAVKLPFTAPKPISPAPADLHGARVLVVDDERSWRVILETDLRMLGYKVTLRSANAFAAAGAQAYLKGASAGNSDTVNYTIKYNGSAVSLVAGDAVVTSAITRTTGSGVSKNLLVTLSGAFNVADTYSDTLTLTLVNN